MFAIPTRTVACAIAALLCAVAAAGSPLLAQSDSRSADERAVLAVADSALAAISRVDFVALTDLMLDSAVTFSTQERDGQSRISFRSRAAQRAMRFNGSITERGFGARAQLSGPLATVWMPYDLYQNGEWSHCGVDAFTMLKTASGAWRIASLVWSVEQPPACARHPDGPPAPPSNH